MYTRRKKYYRVLFFVVRLNFFFFNKRNIKCVLKSTLTSSQQSLYNSRWYTLQHCCNYYLKKKTFRVSEPRNPWHVFFSCGKHDLYSQLFICFVDMFFSSVIVEFLFVKTNWRKRHFVGLIVAKKKKSPQHYTRCTIHKENPIKITLPINTQDRIVFPLLYSFCSPRDYIHRARQILSQTHIMPSNLIIHYAIRRKSIFLFIFLTCITYCFGQW